MLRLADLREILRYVPQYRERTFVIALDGAIVEDANFRNLLLDIALLRSLNIQVALVHGAGWQVRRLAEQTKQTPSNLDGTGINQAFIPNAFGCVVDDGAHLYWPGGKGIVRANLDGTGVQSDFITGLKSLSGCAIGS